MCGPTADTLMPITGTHEPVESETLPIGYNLVVMPGAITEDITLELPNNPPVGTSYRIYGSGSDYTVTVETSVTSGSPYMDIPYFGDVYSYTLAAGTTNQGIELFFDGANWRCRLFGTSSVPPQTNYTTYTPASGQTYTQSITFTAPCNGWIFATSTINVSTSPFPVACQNKVFINGTELGGDSTLYPMTNYGVLYVTAGTACTVSSEFTAGTSSDTFPEISQTATSLFIPV